MVTSGEREKRRDKIKMREGEVQTTGCKMGSRMYYIIQHKEYNHIS